jgi:outer membrane receptor for ferric coprogen and ferric-rhodotorulic acid
MSLFPIRAPSAFASTAIGAAVMLTGTVVRAQTPEVPTPQLSEVTVTGEHDATTEGTGSYTTVGPVSTSTHLGLTPRETPQSMSIVTRARMEEMGLQTLSETMQTTTGIYVNANDTERITYNARGYAITNFQVDGMLNTFGGTLKTNGDNAVYDRIEVVRGATGLTTGAGDPSATINQVRKRPTAIFQGNASVRLGTYDLRRAEVDLSGPVAFEGKVRARVVAAEQKANSFRPLYQENRTVGYGIVEADLGPDTVAALGFERQKSDPRGVTWGTVPYWNADGSRANLPFDLNLSTPWASWNIDEKRTFATLDHRFSPTWRVRVAASRSEREQDGSLYFGYGGYPRPDGSGITVASGRFPSTEKMNVLDLNVDGKFDLLGRRHDVVFGWGRSTRDTDTPQVVNETMPASYGVIPDWRTWSGDVREFGSTTLAVPASRASIEQEGGYLTTRLNLSDPLKAVVGMRYGSYKAVTRNFALRTGLPTTTTTLRNRGIVTPYAGLIYDLGRQWSVYASYTDIFQPQNFRDAGNEFLEPVVGKSYEAGIKGELFERRMNVAAAVFRSKKDNVAEIDDSVPLNSLPGAVQAYRSTGKGNVVDGVELEASGQLNRQWNLFGGYSHTRSRSATGQPINTVIPRNLLRVFTSYRFDGALQGLTLGGGVSWQGGFWSAANQPTGALTPTGAAVTRVSRIDQEGVVLLNLSLGYRINPHLTASLNINNLLDKHYANRVGFYNGVHYSEPRTASIALRADF